MKEFSTPLSRKIGLRYPLVSAPMFIISNKEMLVACAEAGILGAMPSLNARTIEGFKEELAFVKNATDKPFAINVTIGLTQPERLMQDVQACLEYEVPVMITSYGNPTQIVQAAHAAGTIVLHDVINLRHAKKAQAAGVDGIIGVSQGAGGHAGTVNPYVFIPYLRQHLDVPIVGAGCISGGEQVAATLSLGAELAYMGTRFIASTECGADDRFKNMVVDSDHLDIVYTDQVSGTHANFLKQTVPDPERSEGEAKKWKDIWSAGQGVSQIHEVKSIGQIVEDIVREYWDTVSRLAG
ncbi:MAG: nitronate monooxygenase [Proteobacteria bacterium]|nr:nitronate monooxygenase [Pseudomonadota bacterium]